MPRALNVLLELSPWAACRLTNTAIISWLYFKVKAIRDDFMDSIGAINIDTDFKNNDISLLTSLYQMYVCKTAIERKFHGDVNKSNTCI